ncbi:hypothetical protein [Aliiroseovarius sp. S253]|uniref:hypothetical protein n=1 Tax=Aliiroseovarius sp. S253 TaxID=3415133 RepID=UPI003C7A1D30
MKFHWADFLDREGGHWTMTPNDERFKFWVEDCLELPQDTTTVTIGRDVQGIEHLQNLPALEEVTLHETNQAQIEAVSQCDQIKRLRITHARPKSIAAIAKLKKLEEVVLEYVSGFDDISPLAELPELRSLHMENLRAMRDFSPLGQCAKLRYLTISGTFDWPQPVNSISFAANIGTLEFLMLMARLEDVESAKDLTAIGERCQFNFTDNLLPLEIFAYLEAHCSKAKFEPVSRFYSGGDIWLPEDDPRHDLPDAVIAEKHPDIIVCDDGRRLLATESEYDKYLLLGRNARSISVKTKNAADKAAAYRNKYLELVEAAKREPTR